MGFINLCQERHVYIAHSIFDQILINETTGNLREASRPKEKRDTIYHIRGYQTIAYQWEIQKAFLENNNIRPHWIDTGYNSTIYNATTGKWSGAIGLIQSDNIDLSVTPYIDSQNAHHLAATCHFTPGISLYTFHWITRWPQELSLTWNLLYLFPKESGSPKI